MDRVSFQGALPAYGHAAPLSTDQSTNSTKTGGAASREIEKGKLRDVCAEFESLFLQYMLKGMRATIPVGKDGGMGHSREMYTSMMDEQLARELAKGGGIGLADVLFRQICREDGKEEMP